MFPVEAFERTIAKFVAIAESIGLPFHLTGGSISSAYGEPRLTQDIDIVVSPVVVKKRLEDLIARLSVSDFLFTENVVRQSIQSGDLFQLLDKTESLKLDIYPRELIPGELQRSQSMELFVGVFLPVVSRIRSDFPTTAGVDANKSWVSSLVAIMWCSSPTANSEVSPAEDANDFETTFYGHLV